MRLTAYITIAAIGVIFFLLSSLELESEQSQMRARLTLRSDVSLPPPGVWRATTLGFDGFAADLAWIQALQYFGRQQQASRTPVSLRDFADTIASLDPYFYEVYPWFSATYRGTHFPISVEDIETMNEFLDRGIRRFPNRWRLPYKAGMNYIGYPQNRTTSERLREVESAIDYLQRASAIPGAPSNLPLTIGWLFERRRQLRHKLAGESTDGETRSDIDIQSKVDYLTDVYFLIEDAATRRQLANMLRETPAGRRALQERIRGYTEEFAGAKSHHMPYLPAPSWSWTVATESLPFASEVDDTDPAD